MDIVSACLVGIKCRYDGSACTDEKLKKMFDEGALIAVCPECDAGLVAPRSSMEIRGGSADDVFEGSAAVVSEDGGDFTEVFVKGAQLALETARVHKAQKAYLKSKSPSCGCDRIYDGSFSGRLKEGDGITTALLKKNGIMVIEV